MHHIAMKTETIAQMTTTAASRPIMRGTAAVKSDTKRHELRHRIDTAFNRQLTRNYY